MNNEDNQLILYILMRNDMDSLNPGKGMAQSSHATNCFSKKIESLRGFNESSLSDIQFKSWSETTDSGFGTVIVLEVNETELKSAIDNANQLNVIADYVLDPTYPVRDGKVTHLIPIITCGYVFGNKEDSAVKSIVGKFRLHP